MRVSSGLLSNVGDYNDIAPARRTLIFCYT